MDDLSFRERTVRAAERAADYRATLAKRPVRAQTKPGDGGSNSAWADSGPA